MKNISFFHTQEQIKNRTKTVTRRLGWKKLKDGEMLQAVVKCQGLKKGEKIEKLAIIKVVKVNVEPLNTITAEDVIKEGFNTTTQEFVEFFCKSMKCNTTDDVTRIEFEVKERVRLPKKYTLDKVDKWLEDKRIPYYEILEKEGYEINDDMSYDYWRSELLKKGFTFFVLLCDVSYILCELYSQIEEKESNLLNQRITDNKSVKLF